MDQPTDADEVAGRTPFLTVDRDVHARTHKSPEIARRQLAAGAVGLIPHRPEPVGVVRVVPHHVCAAVNLADDLHVRDAAGRVERWRVAARGANT